MTGEIIEYATRAELARLAQVAKREQAYADWHQSWLDTWGWLGELAGRNLFIEQIAFAHNQLVAALSQEIRALQVRLDNQQVTIDDLLKSVGQLRQRVR